MELGYVGLGKMGGGMVQRLLRGGHRVVVSDLDPEAITRMVDQGAVGSSGLDDLVSKLAPPRAIWVMVPAGGPTGHVIGQLRELLEADDLVIDGGNSHFKASRQHGTDLAEEGILFVDAGTSGGVWGLEEGYCLMAGGEERAIERLAPALSTLSEPGGWLHCGPVGSGHYVKMVHNGIEYAMMQAYAEGFELFDESEFPLDKAKIADLWMHGSVVRSWLLELAADALKGNQELEGIAPWVADSGEGRWTVIESIEKAVPAPTITAALHARFRSRQESSYASRFLNLLRNQFGGHSVRKTGGD